MKLVQWSNEGGGSQSKDIPSAIGDILASIACHTTSPCGMMRGCDFMTATAFLRGREEEKTCVWMKALH